MNAFTEKLIVTMLLVVIVAAVFRGVKEAGIITSAFAVALLFANLDKFTKFKGAGIEAELKTAVDQAYAAISELKELGLNLSAPIVDEMAISGQMLKYLHLKYKLERVEKIRENLRKLGASEKEIDEACSTIYERVTSDHLRRILYSLKTSNTGKESLFAGLDDGKMDYLDTAKLDAFIAENKLIETDETKEWMQDFEYFLKNHKLRREDKWQG